MVYLITFIEKIHLWINLEKFLKDSGILANVTTTTDGTDLMSAFYNEVIEMFLQAEQEEHLEYKKSTRNKSEKILFKRENLILYSLKLNTK